MAKSEAVKRLEADLYNNIAAQHPNVPAYAIPRQNREDGTANGLTRCIIDFIELRGWQAERITITGKPNEAKDSRGRTVGVTWTKSHMTIGTADISATIQGRSVKIEVKIGTDRQSDAQRRYQSEIERAGGLYYIARDFNEFVKWYNATLL